MDKKSLRESDIRTKFIAPALRRAGWDEMTQIREEVYFTKGRIILKGKMAHRGKRQFADYILYYKPEIPIAVIEAKDNNHSVAAGMQQALSYSETLNLPFVFSSNGDGFVFHDKTGMSDALETVLTNDSFPAPDVLWRRYCAWKGLSQEIEAIVLQDYFDSGGGKSPRYYQVSAINAVVEAIAKGQNRILLVMATGTGKTYTAFQIIWRLWKSHSKRRILFLADRKVLIDQTMVNDFQPFGSAMTKLSRKAKTIEKIDGKVQIDKSYEIYLALYQAITGPEDKKKIYREFSREFFDLIIIDECHRGSVAEDSAWREILEYFSSATQIGMTATPKETEYASNINYFGEPIYTYSLKQGIQDGFLAPYKVIRIHIDRDIEGYQPEKGKQDREGNPVEDREYNAREFDRTIVLDGRTEVVAQKITEFLKECGDRYQKSIIFCVDQEHAGRLRIALINENADLAKVNHRYAMRITGNDTEGQDHLSNFIDPECDHPVLVTTSRLLSTGVDVVTCRLIVIDRQVGSMTEFKQIVGRGTRIHEDFGKLYFTLIDFRGASSHFADPEFDGEPVEIFEQKSSNQVLPPDVEIESNGEGDDNGHSDGGEGDEKRKKIYVDGVEATIISQTVRYLDKCANLITESLRDYTKRTVLNQYASLDEFVTRWTDSERKRAIVEELESEGLTLETISEELELDLDPFDLICHLAFDSNPITRKERVRNIKNRNAFAEYGEKAKAVLNALLEKYADEGIIDLEDIEILRISPFSSLGTPVQLINAFGGKANYSRAVHKLQTQLYREAA